jgi:transcriptional regulator of arginine metabolism
MTKAQRQAAILATISRASIHTQEDLAEALRRRGVEASQVTLSRDLRELGVFKTGAGYREPSPQPVQEDANTLAAVVRQFLTEAIPAQNLVVLKTRPGGAAALALAIDRAHWPEIIGTVAGDDTILAVAPSHKAAETIAARLRDSA